MLKPVEEARGEICLAYFISVLDLDFRPDFSLNPWFLQYFKNIFNVLKHCVIRVVGKIGFVRSHIVVYFRCTCLIRRWRNGPEGAVVVIDGSNRRFGHRLRCFSVMNKNGH